MRQQIELSDMKIEYGTVLGAALFASALLVVPAIAGTITEREKRDCPKDYHAYCGDYGLGSEALRACMSRNIKKVSNACVAALVDAGEMTQAQADKLRHKATATVTTKKKVTSKSAKTKKTAKTTKTTKTAKTSKTAKSTKKKS